MLAVAVSAALPLAGPARVFWRTPCFLVGRMGKPEPELFDFPLGDHPVSYLIPPQPWPPRKKPPLWPWVLTGLAILVLLFVGCTAVVAASIETTSSPMTVRSVQVALTAGTAATGNDYRH
ncbi:hypothetical protein ACW2Q0_02690 [Nocardia sp. R16R-3T]